MLKITRMDGASATTVLRLEGRLTAGGLPEFTRTLEDCREEGRHVVIDLTGVPFVDDVAAAALVAAARTRVDLVGAGAYVEQILEEEMQ